MKKTQMYLGIIFTTAFMAVVLYYKSGDVGRTILHLMPGIIVGALVGIAFAWWYTKDKLLSIVEGEKAITFALGFFTLISALMFLNSIDLANYDKIQYALEQKGWGHYSEILLRLTVGLAGGIAVFAAVMALMSKIVPTAALAFDAKLEELAATPAAVTPDPGAAGGAGGAAAGAGTTTATGGGTTAAAGGGTTGTGTTTTATTTPAATETKTHPMTWVIGGILLLLLLGKVFGGSDAVTQTATTPPANTGQGTTPPANNPNAAIQLQDESGKINH